MNQSTYFNYNLPQPNDMADISKINTNFTNLDAFLHRTIGENYSNPDTLDARVSAVETGANLEKSAINSFNDGIDSYFKKVVSTIVPVQAGSGTPSPSNVRAISGFTECTVWDRQVNQWDEDWEVGDISRTTGENGFSDSQIRSKNYILVTPDTSYYIGLFKTGEVNIAVCYYDANKNFISAEWGANIVRRTPINCHYIRFTTNAVYGATYNNDISINYPATDTSYHAYNGTTATISFGSAGTVYGGYVDMISGKLVVESTAVTLGSLDWARSETQTIGVYRWFTSIRSNPSSVVATSDEGFLASALSNVTGNAVYSGRAGDNTVGVTENYIYIRCDTATDDTSFINTLGNCQLVYDLATPVEYQLTPAQLRSLVGANNLTSSTGEVTGVEYITNETIAWLLDLIRAN